MLRRLHTCRRSTEGSEADEPWDPSTLFVRAGPVPMRRSFCIQLVSELARIAKETGHAMGCGLTELAAPSDTDAERPLDLSDNGAATGLAALRRLSLQFDQ